MARRIAALILVLTRSAQALNLVAARAPTILQGPASVQKTHLRLCNAFAHDGTLDVHLERTGEQLGLLQYKECTDVSMVPNDGDVLSFFVQGPKTPRLSVGAFEMTGLPTTAELPLLLAVQRRSSSSLRAVFRTHAFEADPRDSAQVAVLDTFLGAPSSSRPLRIAEVAPSNEERQPAVVRPGHRPPQDLLLGTVVAVTPGQYQVSLDSPTGFAPAAKLSAEPKASYVVLRVGENATQAQDGLLAFPEEVIVFPQPKAPERADSFASMIASAFSWVKGFQV